MDKWRVEVSGDRPAEAKAALEHAGISVTSEPVEGTIDGQSTGVTACVEAEDSAQARHRVENALAPVTGVGVGQAARV